VVAITGRRLANMNTMRTRMGPVTAHGSTCKAR
jgi:hypothetical protein